MFCWYKYKRKTNKQNTSAPKKYLFYANITTHTESHWRSSIINSSWWHRKWSHSTRFDSERDCFLMWKLNTKHQHDNNIMVFRNNVLCCVELYRIQNFHMNGDWRWRWRRRQRHSFLVCITSISRLDEFHVNTISYHVCFLFFFFNFPFSSCRFYC